MLPSCSTIIYINTNKTLSIPDFIEKKLRLHKRNQAKIKLSQGEKYNDNGFVICNDSGNMIHPGTFSSLFGDMLEKYNLKHIRFHDLRHSYATLMLGTRENIKIISELLDHSSVKTTGDIYSHVTDDMNRKAASTLNSILYDSSTEAK